MLDLIDYMCSADEANELVKPVSAEEVTAAVNALPTSKVPGPDGFTVEFYKRAWSVVERDLIIAVQSFFLWVFAEKYQWYDSDFSTEARIS